MADNKTRETLLRAAIEEIETRRTFEGIAGRSDYSAGFRAAWLAAAELLRPCDWNAAAASAEV